MKTWISILAALAVLWYLYENLQLEVETNDNNINRLAGLPKYVPLKTLISPPEPSGLAIQVKFSLQ